MRSQTVAGACYGFNVKNVEKTDLLLKPEPNFPTIEINEENFLGAEPETAIGAADSNIRLVTGGHVHATRESGRAIFRRSIPLTPDEMVHPGLASALTPFAFWNGYTPFHGGAFLHNDKAFAILGEKGAGKSSLLAHLATRGFLIVSDDVLVVSGTKVFAGPRCLDLRPDAADILRTDAPFFAVRGGDRMRTITAPVPHELQLGGWLILGWDERRQAEPLRPSHRLEKISEHRFFFVRGGISDLLEATTLPGWSFMRPRQWDDMDDSVERLLEVLSE